MQFGQLSDRLTGKGEGMFPECRSIDPRPGERCRRRFAEQGPVSDCKTPKLPETVRGRDLGYGCRFWSASNQSPARQVHAP